VIEIETMEIIEQLIDQTMVEGVEAVRSIERDPIDRSLL
jgi:hypothetical protein